MSKKVYLPNCVELNISWISRKNCHQLRVAGSLSHYLQGFSSIQPVVEILGISSFPQIISLFRRITPPWKRIDPSPNLGILRKRRRLRPRNPLGLKYQRGNDQMFFFLKDPYASLMLSYNAKKFGTNLKIIMSKCRLNGPISPLPSLLILFSTCSKVLCVK